jgi:YndJ-like protein
VTVLLALAVMVGMLVVVPVGLRLVDGVPALIRRLWLAGAVPGAVSLWLPRGALAAGLAAGYGLATWVLAAHAPVRLWRRRRQVSPRELAVLTALVAPAVAGAALVAERYGYRLLGYELDVLALTVAHFQFAGFVAALVTALVCASTGDRAPARVAALCVPAGVAVVFVGFFTSDVVELAGAAILTAGMWLVGLLTWYEVRRAAPDAVTRTLLATSALVLAGTMLLALSWALGHVVEFPHPSLEWMVATHGLANALGFGLCSMLAWQRIQGMQGGLQWTI